MPGIDRACIEAAHQRVAPYLHRTPVLTSQAINQMVEANIFFKCENFQKVGAFKARGAMNAALQLSSKELEMGIATHSSGNHAAAIAFAARALGSRAFVVMPETSPKAKVAAVQGYGAEITFCRPNLESRESTLNQVVERTGATFVHPFDHEHVIEGQATCGKELVEDAGAKLDAILAPVGGGGLLSGTGLAAHFFSPGTIVRAGEPEGAADAIFSFESGEVESAAFISTVADGLLTNLSERTLQYIRAHVKSIHLVNDTEILAAMRLVYERMKIVIEPSCAVPLAAVIKHRELFTGQNVGIILTGGNVDLARFGEWFGDN